MHYSDGTEAKVGDLVKGTCYNTKNADGTPRVVVGEMLQITPGSETCNCQVGFFESEPVSDEIRTYLINKGLYNVVTLAMLNAGTRRCVAKVDYSECKAFTLVHRPE